MGGTSGAIIRNTPTVGNQQSRVLVLVLGPAHGKGNEMAQWILKVNGNVVPRRSHQPLQVVGIHSLSEINKRKLFDDLIEQRWGTSISLPNKPMGKSDDPVLENYEDNIEEPRTVPDIEDVIYSTQRYNFNWAKN